MSMALLLSLLPTCCQNSAKLAAPARRLRRRRKSGASGAGPKIDSLCPQNRRKARPPGGRTPALYAARHIADEKVFWGYHFLSFVRT